MTILRACLTNGMLAGVLALAALNHVLPAEAAKESVVYSFCALPDCADGGGPGTGLISAHGMLYGTIGGDWHGLAYSINPMTGAETVLYKFCSDPDCTDGINPEAGLINIGGILFGTTEQGGAFGGDSSGEVFSLNPETGTETTLYSFCSQENCADGEYPQAGLLDVGGILYGTTAGTTFPLCIVQDGNCGTVFSLDPRTGAETTLYSFCQQQYCADGETPVADVISVGGVLYGTTVLGGVGGGGTVFSVDPKTATETVVHSFCSQANCTDGLNPNAGLINLDGTLYGTTGHGGTHDTGEHGGTVFSIDTKTGVETVLYSFCSQRKCKDGEGPFAGLINVGGILYGTTGWGGSGSGQDGGGTVFSVDPKTGVEKVLYSFCSRSDCADGDLPRAGLLKSGAALYGTTVGGGASNKGAVFKVALP